MNTRLHQTSSRISTRKLPNHAHFPKLFPADNFFFLYKPVISHSSDIEISISSEDRGITAGNNPHHWELSSLTNAALRTWYSRFRYSSSLLYAVRVIYSATRESPWEAWPRSWSWSAEKPQFKWRCSDCKVNYLSQIFQSWVFFQGTRELAALEYKDDTKLHVSKLILVTLKHTHTQSALNIEHNQAILMTRHNCCCLVAQSSLTLLSWTVARQTSLSVWFSRQEYWSRLPFSSP